MSSPRYVSPLRYPGGKAKMHRWLADTMPVYWKGMDVGVWLEPFAGGLGAGLSALAADLVDEVWAVEIDPCLSALWRTILGPDAEALASWAHSAVPDLELFDAARATVANPRSADDMHLARAAFVLNRCSRSGIVNPKVGPIGGRAQRQYTVASRWNGPALADRLRHVASLRGRLRVWEGSGTDFLADLPGSGMEDEVFVFADPPYVAVGNSLYAAGFGAADHRALAGALLGLRGPWVATYDDHPLITGLYEGEAQLRRFEIGYSAAKHTVATELLVTSPGLQLAPGSPMGRGEISLAA